MSKYHGDRESPFELFTVFPSLNITVIVVDTVTEPTVIPAAQIEVCVSVYMCRRGHYQAKFRRTKSKNY